MPSKPVEATSQRPHQRPFWISALLLPCTIAAGLAVRFAAVGLPPFLIKYGGSALWAVAVYWLASALLPALRPGWAALAAGIIATGVEYFKLYRSSAMDAFRLTLPGVLLLGRHFAYADIVAYRLGILAAAVGDALLRRHNRQ